MNNPQRRKHTFLLEILNKFLRSLRKFEKDLNIVIKLTADFLYVKR